MPIDFHLSLDESRVRTNAARFAQNELRAARSEYLKHTDQNQRFQAQKETYRKAIEGGLIKGQISPVLGGASGSLVDAVIMVEVRIPIDESISLPWFGTTFCTHQVALKECFAVEPSAAITILATGLGATPFNILQQPETRRFLEPFLSGEGAPVASLVFSEPGGVANYLEKGAPGLNTTARLVDDGKYWELNGEKIWAINSAGWDFKGADLACVVCRDTTTTPAPGSDPKDAVMILLVTRADLDGNPPGAFETLRHVTTVGFPSISGPHIRYNNVRVPARNLLCPPGRGAEVAMATFDASAVLVAAMGLGIMRAAFDAALDFGRRDNRRGAVSLLERQPFADLLSSIKMQIEACRAMTWKAAHALEKGPGDYNARRELAIGSKIYVSEAAVTAVNDSIKAVGM